MLPAAAARLLVLCLGPAISELGDRDARRVTVGASLLFVAGFTTVFTIFGIGATLVGSLFLSNRTASCGFVSGRWVTMVPPPALVRPAGLAADMTLPEPPIAVDPRGPGPRHCLDELLARAKASSTD